MTINENYIKELLYDAMNQLRKVDCIGCQNNHPSQTRHGICLTDIDSSYYKRLALDALFEIGSINETEYLYLKQYKLIKLEDRLEIIKDEDGNMIDTVLNV